MAYFDLSSGYHSQTAARESRWSYTIGNDALGKSPFCKGFVVFAGPPLWSVHINEGFGGRAIFAEVNFVIHQLSERK